MVYQLETPSPDNDQSTECDAALLYYDSTPRPKYYTIQACLVNGNCPYSCPCP